MASRYGDLGVDVNKKGIEAFKDVTSGLYRHSFCEIHPDPEMPDYGFVHHTDSAGSKPVQNYLNWKVTGDVNAFRGIAQDALAMNVGDSLCVGIPTSGSFVDYIAINGTQVPKGDVLKILSEDFGELFEMLSKYDINIKFAGGETADLPDQLDALDVAGAIHTRYKLDDIITGNEIKPGDVIVGLSSGGKAVYENSSSGSIMCNGITLARHSLMKKEYGEKYPEILGKKGYWGPFDVTSRVEGIEGTVGEEITMPTRIFAPVFKGILEEFGDNVHGIIFNTGGGQTKCLRVGNGIRYIKDALPEPPQIFKLVQKYGDVPWKEMYQDFNMGIGADVIVDERVKKDVADFSNDEFGIGAFQTGVCRTARGINKLTVDSPHGNFEYKGGH